MSQGPEPPGAVAGPTVSRSVWISGPVPASGVRLPPWSASSRAPQRAARVSRIAGEAKLHPFVAGKCMQQCRAFSEKDLRGILEEAADIEEKVKTGRLMDRMGVELFIVKNSGM